MISPPRFLSAIGARHQLYQHFERKPEQLGMHHYCNRDYRAVSLLSRDDCSFIGIRLITASFSPRYF